MRVVVALLCLFNCCFGSEYSSWLEQVKSRTDQQGIDWFREKLTSDLPKSDRVNLESLLQYPCNNCFSGGISNMEPELYVFISFSVPEETWLQLSKEMESRADVFVIRGLPNKSFQEFAKRVIDLKMKGMNVDVQINPDLFKQFKVNAVPIFVVRNNRANQSKKEEFLKVSVYSGLDQFDTISGNISLEYALQHTSNSGI